MFIRKVFFTKEQRKKNLKKKLTRGNPYDGWAFNKVLGEGSYGKVCLYSFHRENFVACKTFDKEKEASEEEFLCEFDALRKIKKQHNNVIQFLQAYETDDEFGIAFKYYQGGDLSKMQKNLPHYTEATVREIAKQVAGALQYLNNSTQMAHRDIKPANILVKTWEPIEVVVADFNFAKALPLWCNTVTGFATRLGTAEYQAPEIDTTQNRYSYKCDIWSLGVVLYELLSYGNRPSRSAILPELRFEPEIAWGNVSDEGKAVLRLMLREEPKERPDYKDILRHSWMSAVLDEVTLQREVPTTDVDDVGSSSYLFSARSK